MDMRVRELVLYAWKSGDHYLCGQNERTDQNPLTCPPLVRYFELGPDSFQVHESDEDDLDVYA